MPAEIDTSNKFMVGASVSGNFITLHHPPRIGSTLTPDEALVLAAYLVSMAEPSASHTFKEVLEAVQGA